MPATPVTSSSVASATTGATRCHGLVVIGSAMSKSVAVVFTWLVLLRLGVNVLSQLTFSQAEEHFPRQSGACDLRGCNIRV